jgi:hypothetical protein
VVEVLSLFFISLLKLGLKHHFLLEGFDTPVLFVINGIYSGLLHFLLLGLSVSTLKNVILFFLKVEFLF